MRVVIATALLWFVPVILGPPLLSSDIYSYAAEGDMVTKGHDPTSQGMYKLRFGEYISHTDPVWRSPTGGNPYGPVQMGIAAGAVEATGHTFVLTIWLLRFIALGAVLLSVWAIADIARRHGVSPPVAVAIGIANPIAVLHLVGGGAQRRDPHGISVCRVRVRATRTVLARGRFHRARDRGQTAGRGGARLSRLVPARSRRCGEGAAQGHRQGVRGRLLASS